MENGKAPSHSKTQEQAKAEPIVVKTEPFILIYGRQIEVIQILCDELAKFGRQVAGTDDHIALGLLAAKHKIDFIVVGGELPEQQRLDTVDAVGKINPKLPVYLVDGGVDSSPYDTIDFTNRKAVEWKVAQVREEGHAPGKA